MAGFMKKVHPFIPVAAMIALSQIPAAPAQAASRGAPQKSTIVTVFGEDGCPQSTDPNEVVVCARRPENERYRIPKELRKKEERPSEVSWASRVGDLENENRMMRPNSCSVVGSYGQTGCFQQMMSEWFAARREIQSSSGK